MNFKGLQASVEVALPLMMTASRFFPPYQQLFSNILGKLQSLQLH